MTNSKVLGYQKGSFSMESTETVQHYKNGTSIFLNNEVQAFDPSLNFISKATSIMTSDSVKAKALSQGTVEKSYTKSEMDALAKPSWSNGWTRFPVKGF
jgi:hypothetical protein